MKIKAGLLPFYLKLYDDTTPEYRPRLEKYVKEITDMLTARGIEITCAPICRVHDEFESAMDMLEAADLDALITLHLAYSPSLCAENAMKRCTLPIVICDTTCDEAFDFYTDEDLIMYNHGIHGVQDMCNLLRRNKKNYVIHAGFYKTSDMLDRVAKSVRVCAVAKALKTSRVGIVGKPFDGMGDFAVPFDELKKDLGITVIQTPVEEFSAFTNGITADDIAAEKAQLKSRYTVDTEIPEEVFDASAKADLSIRKWVEEYNLSAFTVNFLATKKDSALCAMPFCEACASMANGIGYAGEGDVMTAALVGALMKGFGDTSFAEMFCPNWRDGLIYLSHMGEFNEALSQKKPRVVRQDFPYTDAVDPLSIVASYREGKAVYLNLAPRGNGSYALIVCDIELLRVPDDHAFKLNINGWFKPACGLERFLEKFSLAGGTHHGAVIYGTDAKTLSALADMCGFEKIIIE